MKTPTILIVEDNPLNMKLVQSLLKLAEYQVLEAEDAEKGLQLVSSHRPDLVLMDIQLPGMDGLEATRIIKGNEALTHIPVVALTSYAMPGDEEKAKQAQCDGYISKPINTRTFLDNIKGFLGYEGSTVQLIPKQPVRHRSKILIVDDEPLNIKLLEGKLPREKYEILKAVNGEEALEKVLSESPDLILLDIMMPGMDGFEVTRRLKSDPETDRIPIIQITALDGSEDKIMGLEAGADEFLNKPVNTAELLARVNSLLRLKQYQEQLTSRTRSENSFSLAQGDRGVLSEKKNLPKILLVDDDRFDSSLIQNFLHDGPYHLEAVKNGEEALTLVDQEKIDLILLDVLLPGLTGFEVCRLLKEKNSTKNIQVVLITCLKDLENKIKGVELGADDYLIKPIDRRELTARINVLLKKKEHLDKLQMDYERALNSATTDGLTGLFNQAYLKRFLDLELKRALRQDYPLSFILIDLDNFKHINDTLGHLGGDRVLKELSWVIKENIREIDFAARYGGDEFALVLPYANQEEALVIAERIQASVSSHSFLPESSARPDPVKISMGIAVCPAHATTSEELIRNSDKALYLSKRQGKNRISVFG